MGAIERVQQLRREVSAASRELDSLSGPRVGVSGANPGIGLRGASAADMRGLTRGLAALGGKVDRLGRVRPDPFLADLMRSGPRRV